MRKRQALILLMAVFFLISAVFTVQCTKTQTNKQDTSVRDMAVTGEIDQVRHSYIIRAQKPSMIIFTVLNPDPKILDEYVKSGKIVDVDVRIVSGDNVEIMTIDGKEYSPKKE